MDEDSYSDVWGAISSMKHRIENLERENENLQNQIDAIRNNL